MNAPVSKGALSVRLADLTDVSQVTVIDRWINAHPNSSPFHRPKWLCAVEQGTSQQAHMLVVERDSMLLAALPFHLMHSPLFGRALVSSGFAIGGGILSRDASATRQLAAEICRLAERWSCPLIELRGGPTPKGRQWTEKSDAHANFLRPLENDDATQLLAVPRKQRAELRKGLQIGLTVEVGRGQKDIDWHYAVYAESVRNLGTPVFPKALMEAVMQAFGAEADILTVFAGKRPVASVLSLYHRATVMPYWGGGVGDARTLRANDVMYYTLMNHARRQGYTHFDFGRSKTGSGAYLFKKNWGFEPSPLSYAFNTKDGHAARDINPNSPKYRAQIAMWQKLPLAITNRLGPWIAKGLG